MARFIGVLFACLALAAGRTQALEQEATPYSLLARSPAAAVRLQLTPPQQQWLKGRQQLTLGTSAPDYPPSISPVEGATTKA